MRADYYAINPDAIKAFAETRKSLKHIDSNLKALLEIRISQINGCAYCLDLHANEARHAGELQQRLDCLAAWNETDLFTDAEYAPLAWAEAVTHISETRAPQKLYDDLAKHYSPEEIVDITYVISFMNAWNRIAVSFSKHPTRRQKRD